MGRTIQLPNSPAKRIISLVPSLTELLFDLGLDQEVVGITKFCIHPKQWFDNKPRVGGTKQVDFNKIAALKPDLIIANKEENQQQQVEMLMKDYTVWMSDITTLAEALSMILSVGELVGRSEVAEALVEEIKKRFTALLSRNIPLKKAIYLIWKDPIMAAGKGTFIDDMLQYAGFENQLQSELGRYPVLTLDALKELNPEYLLLSSEPYPFSTKHLDYFQSVLPATKINLVDGEYFSWYGSRLKDAPGYYSNIQFA